MIELKGIKNIIFDFGGVILDLAPQKTVDAFKGLGETNLDFDLYNYIHHEVFGAYEKGLIDTDEFYNKMQSFYKQPVRNEQIKNAWNAMLVGIPKERITLLEQLKERYRTFLLSNSNINHYQYYTTQLKETHGYDNFDQLFEKAYFSFDVKMSKPNPDFYKLVLNTHDLKPEETLFIDDNEENIIAADILGIKTHYLLLGKEDIIDVLSINDKSTSSFT